MAMGLYTLARKDSLIPPLVDDEIRECVFLSLDQRFDPHLAQAENLTTLFVAMHDGVRAALLRMQSPFLTRTFIMSVGVSNP